MRLSNLRDWSTVTPRSLQNQEALMVGHQGGTQVINVTNRAFVYSNIKLPHFTPV